MQQKNDLLFFSIRGGAGLKNAKITLDSEVSTKFLKYI